MHKVATVASSLFSRITHWLVIRNGARYVLAGTIALAALGAVVANQDLPKPPAISSVLPIGDNDHGHYGWYGWHRHHHGGWQGRDYYFGHQQTYDGTWSQGSWGGNGYVGQGGSGSTGQSGSGY